MHIITFHHHGKYSMPRRFGLLSKIFATKLASMQSNLGALPIVMRDFMNPALIIRIENGLCIHLSNKPSQNVVKAALAAP